MIEIGLCTFEGRSRILTDPDGQRDAASIPVDLAADMRLVSEPIAQEAGEFCNGNSSRRNLDFAVVAPAAGDTLRFADIVEIGLGHQPVQSVENLLGKNSPVESLTDEIGRRLEGLRDEALGVGGLPHQNG